MKDKLIRFSVATLTLLSMSFPVFADDTTLATKDAKLTANIQAGGLQLQDLTTSINFSSFNVTDLLRQSDDTTSNFDSTSGYKMTGTMLSGNILNYSTSPAWQLQATFTGMHKASLDLNNNQYSFDPAGKELATTLTLANKTLLSDSPVVILQGGDTGTATANGNITASGFGTTKIDDFGIVPALVRPKLMTSVLCRLCTFTV
ncbi:hypothetical protein LA429_04015 [Weissella cibaria]|uniref:hypothetical protein n=1 Tax=Weissella cibaria TaxID=137591 RepID=UPI001E49F0E0|nr:hypothetical protein [Weissella cibaria]MCC6121901.1 hypothetical protein [Weissella cibaria]